MTESSTLCGEDIREQHIQLLEEYEETIESSTLSLLEAIDNEYEENECCDITPMSIEEIQERHQQLLHDMQNNIGNYSISSNYISSIYKNRANNFNIFYAQ